MIKHVLKDGTEVENISGMVVKAEDFPVVYEVISKIQKGCNDEPIQTSD